MNKAEREAVWNKYNHHCAYCGKEIEYKDMQVDHLIPQRYLKLKSQMKLWDKIETSENYMPSCRRCNHYKRAHSLETFRRYVAEIPKKLRENYIAKVGMDYELVHFTDKPIVFYFEQEDNK